MKSINSPEDLITTQTSTIEGFAWQAKQKLIKAEEYKTQTEYFRSKVDDINDINVIRLDSKLYDFFTAACMLSKKSLNHLPDTIQNEILRTLIDLDKLGNPEYIRELERRYYLSSGDALGGSIRNIIGKSAQESLTKRINERLLGRSIKPEIIRNKKRTKIQEIIWTNRRILFDKNPNFIGNSIDIIVIKEPSAFSGDLENPSDYMCCGELKGGIDPAGADEHWKTARSALRRIDDTFLGLNVKTPNLVFLGKAIERSMAIEIFGLLESNWLSGAANINNPDQLDEVIDIIIA